MLKYNVLLTDLANKYHEKVAIGNEQHTGWAISPYPLYISYMWSISVCCPSFSLHNMRRCNLRTGCSGVGIRGNGVPTLLHTNLIGRCIFLPCVFPHLFFSTTSLSVTVTQLFVGISGTKGTKLKRESD